MMKYKNYVAYIAFDSEANVYHGHAAGLKDVITFQGASVDELRQAFKDSVKDYLEWCAELGEKPEEGPLGSITLKHYSR